MECVAEYCTDSITRPQLQSRVLRLHLISSHDLFRFELWAGNIDTVSKFIDLESLSGVTKEEWRQVRHTFKKSAQILFTVRHTLGY
uniref:Uncharacterized protein n=1 Tax=Lactuca sativa TaxID=4236 RepID=A0A9R1USX5_LACSA|nr:hypothetical protein LSAT_V11C800413610 [Lactuca sativa]